MTYAESITRRIDKQRNELRRLLDEADEGTAARFHGDQWSANEVLLHLIGATGDVPVGLRRALTEDGPTIVARQAGGEYLLHPGSDSAAQLLPVLLAQLEEIADAVCDLDDQALQRPVRLAGEGGVNAGLQVGVGLWIQNAIGEHFELHIPQLRQALEQAPGG